MKKKIALAVDGSVHCSHAVNYAVAMYRTLPELHYVLIHVQPALSQYLTDEAERSLKARSALNKIIKANRENSNKLIEKIRGQMVRLGIDPDRIETCSRIQTTGTAEDLMDECKTNAYDAVVLGRRGVSYFQELVTGSVTANMIEHATLIPVWMVDGEVTSSRILLAADGSQNSLRALDHLAFMLSGQEEATIHVLHIKPQLREVCDIGYDEDTMAAAEEILLDGDRHCIDGFHAQAKEIVRHNGLDPDRMKVRTVASRVSITGTLLDVARKERIGTIVVGRRGLQKRKLTGSISRKILQKANRTAVWLVP